MPLTLTSPPSAPRRVPRRKTSAAPHAARARSRHERGVRAERYVLGRYIDGGGLAHEVVSQPGFAGSLLVVDCDVACRSEQRLVAHLGADEPHENAALVCEHYLRDAPGGRCRCRRLTIEDCRTNPFPEGLGAGASWVPSIDARTAPVDDAGRFYQLELLESGMSIPELRWCQHRPSEAEAEPRSVSVRGAIASLEDYEPVRTITAEALALHRSDSVVSTTVLRAELARINDSPIVLNRRLRRVVLATIEREDLSMSEIAIRCGRVKQDRRGNESGETSWLARRLGILPEGGRDEPTPWIHSDVLALISRRGLGISPREVELG